MCWELHGGRSISQLWWWELAPISLDQEAEKGNTGAQLGFPNLYPEKHGEFSFIGFAEF